MTRRAETPEPFSRTLRQWLKTPGHKTLLDLGKLSQEKSFAITFVILMALPALPLPTGGVTHVTELIAALICLQMIIGRTTIWLPGWALRRVNVGKLLSGKAGSKLISVIAWFEKFSRRRLGGLLAQRLVLSLLGLVILVLTVAAFVAPPFSGLDTLPALGVVVVSLGLILEDLLIVLGGIVIGALGIGLEIAAGTALYSGLHHFF